MHMITPKQVEEELRISNDRFIAELGIRPDLFAYPYSEYNLTVIEAVKRQASLQRLAKIQES